MKKETKIKNLLFALFFVFFFQTLTPTQAIGATLNWENPNKNGNNPYKISTDAILNSSTLMQVVGCTGVVDKVSEYTTDFLKKQAEQLLKKIFKTEKVEEAKREGCKMVKKSTTIGAAPVWNTSYSAAFGLTIDCSELYNSTDKKTQQKLDDLKKQEASAKKREECFNGLAYTLAKNQLTSMTRETINWINTGFNGDPMYVQNITSLTNSIERNVLERSIQDLSNGAFPYGRDFARSAINSYNAGGIGSGAKSFDNLVSDFSAFVIGVGIDETKTALERERIAIDTFSNDFSSGGWDAYLALTQRDQNNPLGFAMLASENIADQMKKKVTEVKDEVTMGDGFLSQKRCVLWKLHDAQKNAIRKDGKYVYSESKTSENDACEKYNIVTPGSVIKEKLNTSINTPERQLELADTINEFLNGLFTSLIQNFRQEGLAGLSAEKFQYNDEAMGLGYGSNSYDETEISGSNYDLNNDGYTKDGSFDLTRDLGNTYNHKETKALGTWNAKTNTPELNIGLAPYNTNAGEYYSAGVYYIVTTAGSTKLFNNGYNGWAIGDRAFWNGKEWQNWKKGQTSPIEKRGIIQTQKDYTVATKELLKKLPGIMPKIGELDYCIPGPNENILITSRETSQAFLDLAGSITGTPADNDGVYTKYSLDEDIYQNYINYIPQTLIQIIRNTIPVLSLLQFDIKEKEIDDAWATRKLDENINLVAKDTNKDIQNFYDTYLSKVVDGFYGKIKSQFITNESTSAVTENPKYLPMINAGIAITKNMVQYDEEITSSTENYLESIVQAEENTVKLTAIKAQVSKIINDAQKRRDAKLLEILRKETIKTCNDNYAKCMSSGYGLTPQEASRQGERGQLCSAKKTACEKKTITEKEYQTKYASCFEEENIHYYDDQEIMNYQGDETLRCSDRLDNDLDGMVDSKDPDCVGGIGGGTGGVGSGNGTPNTTIHLSTGPSGVVATTTPSNPQAPSGVGGSLVLKINEETACDTSDQNGYGYETSDCLSFNYAVYPTNTIKIIATGYQNYYNNNYKVKSIKLTANNTTYYSYTYKTGDPSYVNHTYQIPYGAPNLYNLSVEFSPK
jgi:hypothetical protein